MKNFLLFMCLIIGISSYAGVKFAKNDRVLRVGTECDYAPNNWEENVATNSNVPLENAQGRYAEGYDIQIAKRVADSIGAELKVIKIEWENLIPALKRHEIDVIFSGMLDTSERKKFIAFTETYEDRTTEYGILVQKDGKFADAKKLTDFKGARFVGQVGTNLDTAIDQVPGAIHLPPVDTASKMLEKLSKNEADAIITDIEIISMYNKTYPNLKPIKLNGDAFVFDYSGVCAGVRQEDKKLADEINGALAKISKRERQRIMDQMITKEWDNI